MASFTIASLRGGMNNTDPAISLPDDQCILAENAEFVASMLGERRRGTDAIDLPASISGKDRVPFVFRHLPTGDETASELWVLGVTGTTTAVLAKKDTAWSDITISDTPTLTGAYQYQWQGKSLHGKLFLAYKSDVDRLHVVDAGATAARRVGLKAPTAAPTAANAGSGSLAGTRYYRQRYTVKDGSTTLRRSEPSAVLTFAPSGSGASITVTKAADTGENATHWELEASLDNANFYVLATTVVGTTTVSDTQSLNAGYAGFTLSEDIEDYALIPSVKYLAVDGDRLLWARSYEDAELASRFGWTPVYAAAGVGNDERVETDTDPYVDLDAQDGGPITGLSDTVLGANWIFKSRATYKAIRTGKRNAAYAVIKYSDAIGAVDGSVVTGVDAAGQPCLYFLDLSQGPCRLGVGGIKRCGEDLRTTWSRLNVNAASVVASAVYYPEAKQVIWNIAVDSGDTPTVGIVLHVDKAREFADGIRRGWTTWTGTRASALSMCLYADNVDANTTRSRRLVPFLGLSGSGLVHRCDTGITDNGTAYAATITTKPYLLSSLLATFEVTSAVLLAKVVASAAVTLKCIRDFALQTTATVSDVSLAGSGGAETDTVVALQDLAGANLRVVQFQFTDVASPAARWEINQLAIRGEKGAND